MKRILVVLIWLLLPVAAQAETLNATLDWSQRVGLGLTVSGVIATVSVKPGQRVEQGQPLVALDNSYLQARIVRAEAELEEARQNRDEGARELERANELYDRTVLSDHDLQLAQIGEIRAKAAWQRARAALAEARILLRQSRVLAPFTGVIIKVAAQPGQAVVNGLSAETLIEMARDDRLIARTGINPEQLARLAVGQDTSVRIGTERVTAKVHHIGLEPLDGALESPLYELQVIFDRPDSLAARVGLPLVIDTGE